MLVGSNGREVAFVGVKQATPQSLVLLMEEGGEPMAVGWDKFDMLDLEKTHRKIYRAYVDAQSYGKTVPLNLGIYAEYKSYNQCLAELSEQFDEPYSVSVPTYDDYVDSYRRMYYNSWSDYENYAKARRKIFEDYQDFIEEFFAGKNIRLNVSQSSWSENVYSANPDKRSVDVTPREIIEYFALENNRTRKEAMAYIQNDRSVLEKPLSILSSLKEEVPSPLFDRTNPEEIYFSTLLENNIRDLEHLNTEKTFPHSALRNFEKLLTALKKGKALEQGS